MKKKTAGYILTIIGLVLIIVGFVVAQNWNDKRYLRSMIDDRQIYFEEEMNKGIASGLGTSFIGLVILIIGIVKIGSKDKRIKELDSNIKIPNSSAKKEIENLSQQVKVYFSQKDYGKAIALLNRILQIDDKDVHAYYNLACVYSLSNRKEAINALANAIKNGYSDFNKIDTSPYLEWIRQQSEFIVFKQNGYKLVDTPQNIGSKEKSKEISTSNIDNVLNQIEKLGKLKEQGLISDEEFTVQKKKLLES